MPLIDLPVSELATYRGRTPKPHDFDGFWDHAIEVVSALDPQVELTPVDTPARFARAYELRFTGLKGARIFAKLLVPAQAAGPAPALLQFHGYSMDSGDWVDKLSYVASGFCVSAMDCRGQGGRSQDVGGAPGPTLRGHIVRGLEGEPGDLLFHHIFCDCFQLARIVMAMPEVDATRVATMGASQGGGLALACAALEPRIARAVSIYPFLCDYQRVWEMDLAQDAYLELRQYFRSHDPRHERKTEVFERLGYIDVQHLAPRIRASVLMATGLMDTICPPSTQYAAFNALSGPRQMVHYPDFGHEGLPGFGDIAFRFLHEMLEPA